MKVLVTARLPEEVLAQLRREHQVESYTEDPPMAGLRSERPANCLNWAALQGRDSR
jgi:hypothetical protein